MPVPIRSLGLFSTVSKALSRSLSSVMGLRHDYFTVPVELASYILDGDCSREIQREWCSYRIIMLSS